MRKTLIKKVPLATPDRPTSRWALLEQVEIPDRAQPERTYLRRTRLLATPWFSLYLHNILLPDGDRDLHDHPWVFWSWVLRGGYREQETSNPERRAPWWHEVNLNTWWRRTVHRMPLDRAHKITHVDPDTWTLVLVGRRRRDWGFWTEQGFVRWQDYDQAGLGPDPFES